MLTGSTAAKIVSVDCLPKLQHSLAIVCGSIDETA